jgi:hypothetical protein
MTFCTLGHDGVPFLDEPTWQGFLRTGIAFGSGDFTLYSAEGRG